MFNDVFRHSEKLVAMRTKQNRAKKTQTKCDHITVESPNSCSWAVDVFVSAFARHLYLLNVIKAAQRLDNGTKVQSIFDFSLVIHANTAAAWQASHSYIWSIAFASTSFSAWLPPQTIARILEPKQVIQMNFEKFISAPKTNAIALKSWSIAAKICLLSSSRKSPNKLAGYPWILLEFPSHSTDSINSNAKLSAPSCPFQKGIDRRILCARSAWKHFPKLILNESKIHGG